MNLYAIRPGRMPALAACLRFGHLRYTVRYFAPDGKAVLASKWVCTSCGAFEHTNPVACDGVTDDAPAFQRALDAVAGGGTVYPPPGTYKIASSLKI